jgi:catechol 2,3-dioxygenase-like lactoylglutathione lyase family enzyme
MAKVTGLGGVFVKSANTERLRNFYRDALGMEMQDWGAMLFVDRSPGPRFYNVWSPFAEDSKYFDPSQRPFMVNLRVDDLEGVLARARGAGARVLDRRESGEQGEFGYVLDPDDTLIELWQPPKGDASSE